MKQAILAFVLSLCLGLPTAAQDTLRFLDIPVQGSARSVGSGLEQLGFNYVGDNQGALLYRGQYAGFYNALVAVVYDDARTVTGVSVALPAQSQWQELRSDYLVLKEKLTAKYGQPQECVEQFDQPFYDTSDATRFMGACLGACRYYAAYQVPGGRILLSILHAGDLETPPMVAVDYQLAP